MPAWVSCQAAKNFKQELDDFCTEATRSQARDQIPPDMIQELNLQVPLEEDYASLSCVKEMRQYSIAAGVFSLYSTVYSTTHSVLTA